MTLYPQVSQPEDIFVDQHTKKKKYFPFLTFSYFVIFVADYYFSSHPSMNLWKMKIPSGTISPPNFT